MIPGSRKWSYVLFFIFCLTLMTLPGCSADNVDDATDARSVMPAVTNMAGSQTSAESWILQDLREMMLIFQISGCSPEQILRILRRVQMAGKSSMTILMLTAG